MSAKLDSKVHFRVDSVTGSPAVLPIDKPEDVPAKPPTDRPGDSPTDNPTEKPIDIPTDTPNDEPKAALVNSFVDAGMSDLHAKVPDTSAALSAR